MSAENKTSLWEDWEETERVLEKFFYECLRFWEKTLNVDSDLSNEAYKNAIEEIPETYPYHPQGEKLNPVFIARFKKLRLMDCYGKDWEKYMDEKTKKLLQN